MVDQWLTSWIEARNIAGEFARTSSADKPIIDVEIAEEWAKAMKLEWGTEITEIKSWAPNPPDCVATCDGKPLSIELVEFIDGSRVAKNAAAKKIGIAYPTHCHGPDFINSIWTKDRFVTKLIDLIDAKNGKYAKRDVSVDAIVIHTDEPFLARSQVEDWLAGCKFEAHSQLRSAFLLMTYDPAIKRWPIFLLFGSQRCVN